jgi:CheY-like chemotaxis protein
VANSVSVQRSVGQNKVVLLIENDENDVFAFRRALAHCHYAGAVRVVGTCWQARDYIEGRNAYADRRYSPLPDLIVSDFHLPGATGIEFVKWLREQPAFAQIPVVIWTGSMACAELEKVLAAGATSHQLKTAEFKTLCGNIEKMLSHLRV